MPPKLPSDTPGHRRAPARTGSGPRPAAALLMLLGAALLAATGPVRAEKADRDKKIEITTDGSVPGRMDLVKRVFVFAGDVVITQGTLQIHADRVEMHEDAQGAQIGVATGRGDQPVKFRQKREGEDEWAEGESQRVEYDSGANRVRFIGDAHLRLLKGKGVTDEINAALITYNTLSSQAEIDGSAPRSATAAASAASSAGGRATYVLTPRRAASAASGAAAVETAGKPGERK